MSSTTGVSPIETVEQIYAAFFRGDLDSVMRLCAPDASISEDPALPWGGHYVGRDGVAAFAQKLFAMVDSTISPEVIFQAGDHVVQHGRARGIVRHSRTSYDIDECHVWTFRNGLVTAAELFIDSEKMLAALAS